MSYVRIQKAKYENGITRQGSGAILESVYMAKGTYHSKQKKLESLGRVIYYDKTKECGIFQSPTRGLIQYDGKKREFSEVARSDPRLPNSYSDRDPLIHTVFGDIYLLLTFWINSGFSDLLASVFEQKDLRERLYCHLTYSISGLGSRISCDDFINKSCAAAIFNRVPVPTLKSDTHFFDELSSDQLKVSFFKKFVSFMRKRHPDFGRGCYIDSTALPNEIQQLALNAMGSHGGPAENQIRLALVLDEATGIPVWYSLFPGNVLDLSTLNHLIEDVSLSVDVDIFSLVLDAGYVSKQILQSLTEEARKTLIARMPAKKGFPYKSLYSDVKPLIEKAKYGFVCECRVYFGYKKKITLFGNEWNAYVYVDRFKALKGFRDEKMRDPDGFALLKNFEKDWYSIKYGFFVLISNIDTTPEEILTSYLSRVSIESVFKLGKDELNWLPLRKWHSESVKGKLMADMITTLATILLKQKTIPTKESLSSIIGKTQSLMCLNDQGTLKVETPNKQVKEIFANLKLSLPLTVPISEIKGMLGLN